MRPISSPAIDVQNTVSPMMSCGEASASTWSSMPRSRKISIVRWLVMCARGVLAVHRYFVIMMLLIPRVDRHRAAAPPAGPEPTISTSVSTVPCGSSVSACPSSKAGIAAPLLWPGPPLGRALRVSFAGPARDPQPGRQTWRKCLVPRGARPSFRAGAGRDPGRRGGPGRAGDLARALAEVLAEGLGEVRGGGEAAAGGDVAHRSRGAALAGGAAPAGRDRQHRAGQLQPAGQDVARDADPVRGEDP